MPLAMRYVAKLSRIGVSAAPEPERLSVDAARLRARQIICTAIKQHGDMHSPGALR